MSSNESKTPPKTINITLLTQKTRSSAELETLLVKEKKQKKELKQLIDKVNSTTNISPNQQVTRNKKRDKTLKLYENVEMPN